MQPLPREYMVLYGVWRFAIEFSETTGAGSSARFPPPQFISIFLVISGIALLVLVKTGVLKEDRARPANSG
ncbi:MAG: hypothetical protein R2881_04905 [Eubacteriales bacterium]